MHLLIEFTVLNNPYKNNNKQRVLAKVLEYISTADINKLTLQDLSENTYASVRTIQYAFSEGFFVSPKKYIVIERLNRIRKELLNSDPNKEKVSNIIKKYGVVNFGRFRNDYYEMFQEYPKDSLIKE